MQEAHPRDDPISHEILDIFVKMSPPDFFVEISLLASAHRSENFVVPMYPDMIQFLE